MLIGLEEERAENNVNDRRLMLALSFTPGRNTAGSPPTCVTLPDYQEAKAGQEGRNRSCSSDANRSTR